MSVPSINWSDYSASEIVKMSKSGEKVPDKVLQDAQKSLGIKTDSEDKTSYQVVDSSENYNGAQKTRESLKEQGLSGREIAETMTDMCKDKASKITEMLSDVESIMQQVGVAKSEKEMEALVSKLELGINYAGDAIELAKETTVAGKDALRKGGFFKNMKVVREALSTAKKTEALATSLKEQSEEASISANIQIVKDSPADKKKEEEQPKQ